MHVVKINIIGTQKPKTLCTGFLGIFCRTVELRVIWHAFDNAKLGREEDLVTFASLFEPVSKESFIVAVHTAMKDIYVSNLVGDEGL
jgi:hypothetical protein